MKSVLAILLAVIGAVLLIFAFMARSELHAAATSGAAPAKQDMPLTRVIGPEFFESAPAGEIPPKPADLAAGIMRKIYGVTAAGALALIGAVGVLFFSRQDEHD